MHEIEKILEHPVVFECVEDRIEKLPGNSDDGSARVALQSRCTRRSRQAEAVAFGAECTLHLQCGVDDLVVTFSGVSDASFFIEQADSRHHAPSRRRDCRFSHNSGCRR